MIRSIPVSRRPRVHGASRLLFALFCAISQRLTIGSEPIPIDPYFPKVTVDDLTTDSPSGLQVKLGLRRGNEAGDVLVGGDLILAVDGYRVFTRADIDYVRLVRGDVGRPAMEMIVVRKKKVVSLRLMNLGVYRKVLAQVMDKQDTMLKMLRELKVDFPAELAPSLYALNLRAALALDIWLKEDPAHAAQLDWLAEFITLYGHLVNQDWELAAEPRADIPVRYFAKLTDFYLSIAKRNAKGSQFPDHAAHDTDFDFFVFHYPYPRFVAPPLGNVEWSDEIAWKRLVQYHDDPWSLVDPTPRSPIEKEKDNQKEDFSSDYIRRVKHALVDPFRHGAWPFRYAAKFSVESSVARRRLMADLRTKVRLRDQDETLYMLAMIAPLVMDERSDLAIEAVERIRAKSPYLGFLGLKLAQTTAARLYGTNGSEAALASQQELLLHGHQIPFRVTPQRSLCLEYLKQRDRNLLLDGELLWNHAPRTDNALDQPYFRAFAWRRKDPIEQTLIQIDARIARSDFADHRVMLLALLRDTSIPYFDLGDVERLADLGRDGGGRGLILQTLVEILRQNYGYASGHRMLSEAIGDEFVYGLLGETSDQPNTGYAHVYKLLQTLDRSNKKQARDVLVKAFEEHGTPAAAVLILAELKTLGYEQEAQRLRGLVTDYFVYVFHRAKTSPNADQPCMDILAQLSIHPEVKHFAGNWLERLLRESASVLDREPAAQLYQARCFLHVGLVKSSINLVKKSFVGEKPDQVDPIYLYEGRVDSSTEAYRKWLLTQITSHENYNEAMKQHLADSGILEKLPDWKPGE